METIAREVNNLEDNFRNIKYSKAGSLLENIYKGDNVWSKVIFFIFVLILFILSLRGGVRMLSWLMSPDEDPILVNGLKDAKKPLLVNVDPSKKSSQPIIRSVNERGGLEFTWTVWVNIENLKYGESSQDYYHIFNKGNLPKSYKTGQSLDGIQDSPGLYLKKDTNKILIKMTSFNGDTRSESIEVDNIPLNKWINIGIRVKQRILDVFINGEIKKRYKLAGIPKQNYGPVYVNMNGGFDGELSELRYFSRALTGLKLMELAEKGPNMREYSKWGLPTPPYFSQRWFLSRFNFSNDVNVYTS
tara:strand:+ start:253 stop:1158 length:906 start_codon:yes stop_codon:yes gene_type:complete